MEILKKLWNFLVGSKEEEAIEEVDLNKIYDSEEPKETVQHCTSHLRFRKTCPDCLRAIGII